MKSFYLVDAGLVTLATPDTEFDGVDSVLVYASSPEEALALAHQYDQGLVDVDNLWIPAQGRAVAALAAR